jgi:hypothetical protein
MLAQVINNCQGPHCVQGKAKGNLKAPLLVLRPGLNLVPVKQLAEWRKESPGFENLFSLTIKPTKAETADPAKFGKPFLEIRPGELEPKAPLAKMSLKDATETVNLVEDTDLLRSWLSECEPGKQSDLIKAINARAKKIAGGIRAE